MRAQGSTQKYTIIVLYISAFSTLSHEQQQQQLRYYIIIVDWAAHHRKFPTHAERVYFDVYIIYSSIQYIEEYV